MTKEFFLEGFWPLFTMWREKMNVAHPFFMCICIILTRQHFLRFVKSNSIIN